MANKKPSIKKTDKSRAQEGKSSNENTESDFLIVGMGASAGGLETFNQFFEAMPENPGMAFVLVQHLDPTHKSLMVELIKKHTQMEISEVVDHTKVQPNHIYVIPPNKDMAIFNGVLHLMDPMKARGFRKPIDNFFRSLAEDQMGRAVGIILSGTGTEGTLGLKQVKGQGGLAIVQNPDTAKYDGMPRSAIAAESHDFILPVKEIPDMLIKYAKNRKFGLEKKSTKIDTTKNLLEKIFIVLRNETGCNFGDYKSSTVIRRIDKRMALNQIDKLENYLKYIQKDREEVLKLFKELLIGVTSFFRDTEAYEALQKVIIPEILNKKQNGETIRIWVAGCSTGEEAYSLAILFDEEIRKGSKNLKVQIFASDLDGDTINLARQGIYPETIASDISTKRLSRYFLKDKTTFRIKKEIRDQIIFAEHNLIKDPPFSKQDLVSCRNLLIYLNQEAQKRVFTIFHYALKPDGILFLGSSESLGEFASIFEAIDRKNKIFRHKNVVATKVPDISQLFREQSRIVSENSLPIKLKPRENLAGVTERLLLARYAPACAIINNEGDAVYFSGNTGKYLQPSPGEAKLHIVDMAREGLKTDLRALIVKVRKSKKTEISKGVNVKTNGNFQTILLRITPLEPLNTYEGFYMITFEELVQEEIAPVDVKPAKAQEVSEIHALEQELTATKEYLRSTIEELEVSNEELKSSNEELQSSNEELQSTNEELETSKEELQSVNEEIVTINTELTSKIDELALAYDDMNNLLASTEIGTIFLDANLRIKRFTPPLTKIINLIQTDIGRPITHLSSNLVYDGLENDIKQVLQKLVPVTTSVQSSDGTWYKMQILPYRTSENMIEGVVITFVDITHEIQLADDLKNAKKSYEDLLEMSKTIVYTQNKDLKYTSIGNNVQPNFQFAKMVGKKDGDFYSEKDTARLEKIKKEVLKKGKAIRERIDLTIGNATYLYDLMVRPVYANNSLEGIACTLIDITELHEAKKELAKLKIERDEGEKSTK
ncbi:two-component system, chemotaxis family, CheB/CheR fusion protein [Maribacter orientalis]|uniref:protein-glutamate O-methyltransferase n=1 Tax=Maribacter orientalis TaxID=228957 RepID=A0A1H7NXK6_9FLAO|nr:CheR family methyltransferase [Maribacter orientalis]SEL28271.1 two-component system, chemotaxis family, CheB/CheR fusion protein [Maribacter orientalis]